MAGSFHHCVTDNYKYRGTGLLENMGDMKEAVDEMMFMLLLIKNRWGGSNIIEGASDKYFRCFRGEEPWPEWFTSERVNDD
jgi:hypothetical protein